MIVIVMMIVMMDAVDFVGLLMPKGLTVWILCAFLVEMLEMFHNS